MDAHYLPSYWLGILYSALHPPFQRLGSFANLDVSRIPEGDDGFRIVQRWVRDACDDLDDVSSKSVDRSRRYFIVACTLAFDLDRGNALTFIGGTPMYRSRNWPQSPFLEAGEHIIQDFVAFFMAKDELSLYLGVSYLRWAWEMFHGFASLLIYSLSEAFHSKLRIDPNTLCNLAEGISGLFIMTRSCESLEGVLHDVILPRRWFINLILPGTDLRKDSSTLFAFVADIIDLMQRINERMPNLAGSPYIARM